MPAVIPSRITGIGTYRPWRTAGNGAIARRLGIAEDWIASRTGIERRHVAQPDEPLTLMAGHAAREALRAAGPELTDVDAVIVATVTNPRSTPGIAPQVAADLGLPGVPAFDVNAACAGFCHALETARALIAAGSLRRIVVAGADRLSDITDPDDRSTAILFGDGAGAVVVEAAEEPGIGPAVWGSDGTKADAIRTCAPVSTVPESLRQQVVRMHGAAVTRWVKATVPGLVTRILDAAGTDWDGVTAFVPHQANLRLTEALVDALGLPGHVHVADDIRRSGNTSSASIPLAVAALLESGRIQPGDKAVLVGFGGGLCFAGQVITVPRYAVRRPGEDDLTWAESA
jgi:3-oxoacyl-(acyl-carrier-protein) synthase III